MSLVATRLQNWRIEVERFDKNMARPLEYGALDFFIGQTDAANSIISPELRDRAFASMGNTVQLPVINYDGDVTVSNVRSCAIADDENTSALYTIQWVTLAVGFTMVPALYLNNEISYDHDFARKMEKVTRALATALDTYAIAALEANKTEVFADQLYYTVTANTVEVTWNGRMDWLADMNSLMRANAYPGMLHIIGNTGIDSLIRKMAEHDIYNDVNKRLEYEGKVFHYTANLVNDEDKIATAYIVEDGNVGVLTRVDREALMGTVSNFHEWGVTTLPYINLPVGFHYYTAVGDQSASAGDATADLTCGKKEYFGFSVDVAFLVAYNSDPASVANPIIKVEIASPANGQSPFATPVEVVNSEDNPVLTSEIVGS